MREEDRIAKVRRMVADKVLADGSYLTTPVGDLTGVQVALLQAALIGPHADEIVAWLDAHNEGKNNVRP